MSLQVHEMRMVSPNAAGTLVMSSPDHIGGLDRYNSLMIAAILTGATGGTLDVYIQTLVHTSGDSANGTWVDYAHFPQLAAGAAATTRVWTVSRNAQQTTLTTVGTEETPALAANTIVGGEWGAWWRLVCVAGASTSAGSEQLVQVMGSPSQHR